eukprot:COSAG02_NODE_8805_length_2437_cov_7.043199_2_plen_227_part_00
MFGTEVFRGLPLEERRMLEAYPEAARAMFTATWTAFCAQKQALGAQQAQVQMLPTPAGAAAAAPPPANTAGAPAGAMAAQATATARKRRRSNKKPQQCIVTGKFRTCPEGRYLCGNCKEYGWDARGYGDNVPTAKDGTRGWKGYTKNALGAHWANKEVLCNREMHHIKPGSVHEYTGELMTDKAIFTDARVLEFKNGRDRNDRAVPLPRIVPPAPLGPPSGPPPCD